MEAEKYEEIIVHMATTNERLKSLDKIDVRLERVECKVDSISSDGCTIGKNNARRLDVLERWDRRQMVGAGISGGGVAGLMAVLFKLLDKFVA